MRTFKRLIFASAVLALGAGCGAKSKKDPTSDGDTDPNSSDVVPIPVSPGNQIPNSGGDRLPPVDPVKPTASHEVIKGRWVLDVHSSDGNAPALALNDPEFLLDATHGSTNQPISGTVAVATTFTVSNANFSTPTTPSGVASYGSLNVTALSDNALRVCGTTGSSKCTKATIRMYTTGAAGGGLWSDVEGAGLPITSGTSTVGLSAANAAVLAQAAISGTQRTVRLANFTTATSLAIPVAVDFTDAAAGSYATTLVVEYVLE